VLNGEHCTDTTLASSFIRHRAIELCSYRQDHRYTFSCPVLEVELGSCHSRNSPREAPSRGSSMYLNTC